MHIQRVRMHARIDVTTWPVACPSNMLQQKHRLNMRCSLHAATSIYPAVGSHRAPREHQVTEPCLLTPSVDRKQRYTAMTPRVPPILRDKHSEGVNSPRTSGTSSPGVGSPRVGISSPRDGNGRKPPVPKRRGLRQSSSKVSFLSRDVLGSLSAAWLLTVCTCTVMLASGCLC